ncbi:MAG: RNA polymerase sigma factor RpoH [Alphaproteobacteria bacterium]|nr:RNA polymerase sigma factor RpoH [Alphaproteobacteria bacterium]
MSATTLSILDSRASLTLYLAEINKFPMLDANQEYMLAKRFQETGDTAAAHTLTTSHLRLAAKVALSYRHYGLALADLISEANIGLMQAIKKFDPDRGFRLATYAIWWIKAALSEFILKSWSLVKIGTVATQKRLFYNLHKIKSRIGLYSEHGLDDATTRQIADRLGVSPRDVSEMEQRLSGDSSLNTTLSYDSDTNRQDMLADALDIESRVGDAQELALKRRLLDDALASLSAREREIVRARFLSDAPETLEDLGRRFDISRERIRQIEAKAFEKIKKSVRGQAHKLAI